MNRTVIVIGLLLAGAASAESPADIVDRAFAAISTDYQRTWAFTETETNDGATRVGRFDPRRPPGMRWSLLSVDGRAPSEQEVEDYLAENSLVGEEGFVRERLHALRESGVNALNVGFMGQTRTERVKFCEQLRNIVDTL